MTLTNMGPMNKNNTKVSDPSKCILFRKTKVKIIKEIRDGGSLTAKFAVNESIICCICKVHGDDPFITDSFIFVYGKNQTPVINEDKWTLNDVL